MNEFNSEKSTENLLNYKIFEFDWEYNYQMIIWTNLRKNITIVNTPYANINVP